MFEHRSDRLLPRKRFYARVARHLGVAALTVGFALSVGVVGYHALAQLPWIDSFLNASMILGGMGPVDRLTSTASKLFAAFYALFSGLVFIGVSSVLVAPFLHRFFHQLHLDE